MQRSGALEGGLQGSQRLLEGSFEAQRSSRVAGRSGDTDGGTALTLVDVDDAPAGFGGAGTVDAAADGSGLAGGADAEETEAF
ncbi:hypothetical protein, partial [Methylobacterium sp. E-066]|uniref:hypothetical protein n=1 Tax=Methylobacterium sp. E-066 TaxID=2836584 RepID=UPI001FBB3065